MKNTYDSEHGKEWALMRAEHATRIKASGLGPLQQKKAMAFYQTIHWEGGIFIERGYETRAIMADMDPIRQAEAVKLIRAAGRKRHRSLVDNIDLPLLKRQKLHLLNIIDRVDSSHHEEGLRFTSRDSSALHGILNLLDEVQDAARPCKNRKENLRTIRVIAERMGIDQTAMDISELCSAELGDTDA